MDAQTSGSFDNSNRRDAVDERPRQDRDTDRAPQRRPDKPDSEPRERPNADPRPEPDPSPGQVTQIPGPIMN